MKKSFTFCVFTFFAFFGFSQSKEQLVEVVKNTDIKKLNQLKEKFNNEYLLREQRISNYLLANPEVKRKTVIDSKIKEIYDVIDNNEIIYASTSNFNSSRTSRTNKLYTNGGLGLTIEGQGMKAYVWDGGAARNTHVEFPNNKVNIIDGAVIEEHPTHVVGTIVAQGITSNLRGIAFNASADSYDWTNDYAEMATEAANGMLVSNHSYWIGQNAVWSFGSYDIRAKQFDEIANAAPYYLAVTAAGNDRDSFSDPLIGPILNQTGGYKIIRGMQNAKNFLTVGAVNQVLSYVDENSVVMSSFSSWGPTDDGRIKPEIVTKGVSVRSTLSTSDTANGVNQGTSMASPGIAGSALLLQQYYNSVNSSFMRSATLKGLILHTADEAGAYVGPDYEFGWGLINAEKAVTLIQNKSLQLSVLEENTLIQGNVYNKTIYSDGTTPINVSISWTDKAYPNQNGGVVDPSVLYLVNDLDVRVLKNGLTYYPWTLNPAIPYDPAVRTSDNFRDNFEKIQIDIPEAGIYQIVVSHKGSTLVDGIQNFSLLVTGVNQNLANSSFNLENSIFIYPNPANSILNFKLNNDINIEGIEVYDISGKQLILINNNISNSIDVSSLSNGVYFVKFRTNENTIFTKKFVKE